MEARIDRREFLKKVGLASAATVPLSAVLATPVSAGSVTNFHFVTVSSAGAVDGLSHAIVLTGDGIVTASNVFGGGSFLHFDAATGQIIATGAWKATRLLGFRTIGTLGVLGAGVLRMEALFMPIGGERVTHRLRQVCNLPGLTNDDLAEGVTLYAGLLTFMPLEGITAFSIANEPRVG
ncbi:MAG: twin-arginine translocation signal domain-containing protein [Thermomicrobiaceae bacterium]|nr:twin-arginine translocation signal domain-containing protein [Thermomicrobiaceae bacterium]